MGDRFFDALGRRIAATLDKRVKGYEPFTPSDPRALASCLKPGDVLLVEGDSRLSAVIKYLTQSTWSHAAMYVGPIAGRCEDDGEPHVLVEAYLGDGVISAPLSKYRNYHTRICHPVGLTEHDCGVVTRYMIERIGLEYDLKNITDLMRYLFPMPVPVRWRRRMIALGSGDPTRAICSTLIAQAFGAVRYPILAKVEKQAESGAARVKSKLARQEILHIRHHSLYTPRDFDISPYFAVVKPTIAKRFNYKTLTFADQVVCIGETCAPTPANALPAVKAPTLAPSTSPDGGSGIPAVLLQAQETD